MSSLLLPTLAACTVVLVVACAIDTRRTDVPPGAVTTPENSRRLVPARVLRVIDGATIEVEIEGRPRRVRYLGIDFAEDRPADYGVRSIGQQALDFNRFLVEGRIVQLERGPVDADLDGNLLRYVYVGGEMVNKALLTNGYGTVARFPARFRFQPEFFTAEESARAGMRGAWKSTSSTSGQPTSRTGSGQVSPTSVSWRNASPLPVVRRWDSKLQLLRRVGVRDQGKRGPTHRKQDLPPAGRPVLLHDRRR